LPGSVHIRAGLGEREESCPGACQTILDGACPRARQTGFIAPGTA
jgi:hypothetical protein